jgi:hypothetical protein
LNTQGIVSLIVSLALLAGVTLEQGLRPKPKDAEGYHASVRAAVERFPRKFDGWVGQDTPIQQAARALLKPNALLSRHYENTETGQAVEFLIVHCRQAGDMAGHYPPICYPNTGGWELRASRPMRWRAVDLSVRGMEYDFYQSRPGESYHMTVANVLALPTGSTAQSMEGVRAVAADYLERYYGAGQLQMVFHGDMSAQDRVRIFELFLERVAPVLTAIRSGENR